MADGPDSADDVPDAEAAALAEHLAEETARLAARLSFAIAPYTTRDHFALSAAPVAVVFQRAAEPTAKPRHRSGRIRPSLLPFLVDATQRTRDRLAWGEQEDNPYLIALVLASFYAVESVRTGALDLGVARRDPAVSVVPAERATGDVDARRGGTTMRVIAPVEGEDGTELTAAVELSWGPTGR